jgi:hypothetical protein
MLGRVTRGPPLPHKNKTIPADCQSIIGATPLFVDGDSNISKKATEAL